MFRIIRQYPLSFLLYAVVLLTGILLLWMIPRYELHQLLNRGHSGITDAVSRYITLLGDGWFAVAGGILLLSLRIRLGMLWIVSYAGSGLLVQFLKRAVFPEALRPGALLDYMPGLQLVPEISLYTTLAFPSGHTTTAFSIFLLAGLVYRRRAWVFAGMVLAWMVGLSRVYLSQHFLADILAGSLVGLLSALFFYMYFQRLKAAWLDRSLIQLIRQSLRS